MDPLKDGWIDLLQELSTLGTSLKKPLSKGIIHHPRPLNDLKTSTTSSRKAMNRYTKLGNGTNSWDDTNSSSDGNTNYGCHSQKWHEGTSSRNISSSSDTDRLAAVISKLDNLGRDMKKLKENVHAIQVGCQICEGPHLDKECPLNEEVKQVDEVKYGEFGRPVPFNGSSGAKFRVGPPGYYTRINNQTSYREKKPNLVKTINKYMEEATKRQAEQDDWLKKFCQNTKNSLIDYDKIIQKLESRVKTLAPKVETKEALVHKTMESLKKIKINQPFLKEIRQTDNYPRYMKDLVANKQSTEDDDEVRMNPRSLALL
ncbi:hypothetical protein Tco_0582731 [Tanacetum coccineum]